MNPSTKFRAILLSLLSGIMTSTAIAQQPLTPRLHSHRQAIEQMALCAGVNVANKKHIEKIAIVRDKKDKLTAQADRNLRVFSDAIDGIASRFSAPLMIYNPKVLEEVLQLATARAMHYENEATAKLAAGDNIDEHLQGCNGLAAQFDKDMGHRLSELGLNAVERKETAQELAQPQEAARCFAVADKWLQENQGSKKVSRDMAHYEFFMGVESFKYFLEDLRPQVSEEVLEEIAATSIESHANELGIYWDEADSTAKNAWFNYCWKPKN